ncbi:hypothetical protein Syncc8109_0557 [Synechococcus sp. WH 8109]|uniref:hypothetical protein n=1 Tax=Synechococcus sp. WH 8109 TaxID=166314 RepID=UPI0001B8E0D1|nr:hypothetical protein [Synechococcus sp. WH 8109]AHF62944.1 hypothetical protein Syncc8109_0557 [Synechococcus sp. WH 8109]
MASSLLTSVLVAAGGAVGGPPGSAAPSARTIGEPLHDSSPQALELTKHLKAIGVKFYGAWTCPACFKQMNLFGKQAGANLTYVECRKPKQLPEQAEACNAAKIRAYPTWVLPDGRRKVGVQSLEALSRWSGLN